ncbi:MAG: hypothetical protein ACRERU_06840 [Methylococcales bacterium]
MHYPIVIRLGLFFAIAVVFQGPVAAASEYPAAYFEPYIVYQAPEIAGKPPTDTGNNASEEAPSGPTEENPYPAAYFQPVIVYQDPDVIAAQAKQKAALPEPVPALKPDASAKQNNPAPAESAPAPLSEKGGVPVGILLLIAAVAGGLYWVISRNKSGTAAEAFSAEAAVAGGDETASGEPGSHEAEQPDVS